MQRIRPTSTARQIASIEAPGRQDRVRRKESSCLDVPGWASTGRRHIVNRPTPMDTHDDRRRWRVPLGFEGERRPAVGFRRSQVLKRIAGSTIFFLIFSAGAGKGASGSSATISVPSQPAGGPALAYVDKLLNLMFSGSVLASLVAISRTLRRIEGELKGVATKEDVARLASKRDIAQLATKADTAQLATRRD